MEPPSRYSIGIVNRSGVPAPAALIRAGVRAALSQSQTPKARVAILLSDDAEIRDLNRSFRNLDEATDVLSFPTEENSWGGADRSFLGDVAISVPYAQRQASVRGVPLPVELSYLAIHGTLHLVGLDDQTDEDRLVMLKAMNEAGVAAGLPPDTEWSSLLHSEASA